MNIEDIITQLIANTGSFLYPITNAAAHLAYTNVQVWYDHYLSWKDYQFMYVAYFEKLVGPKGGGSLEGQVHEIHGIASHIGLAMNDEAVKKVAENLFGDTGTFRKGQVGAWKLHFTKEHKRIFKEIAGRFLIDLGYEKDLNR